MGRVRVQHEKLRVLTPCWNRAKWLVKQGAILEVRRNDETDKDHQVGDADLEIRFIKDCTLWLLLIECKRDDGKGVHRTKQKEYRDKYELCHNVVYALVESVKEMDKIVEEFTGFCQNKINNISLD